MLDSYMPSKRCVIPTAELNNVRPPSLHQNRIDVRTLEDYNKGIMRTVEGIARYGDIKLDFNEANRFDEFLGYLQQNDKQPFTVQFPDGTEWLFQGFVTGVAPTASVDGTRTMRVDIRPSGPFNIKTKEEGRMFPKGARTMPANPPADLKPFYVGSNSIPADWSHADLKTAVAHATELVNDRTNNQDAVFIVKVVKVVHRKAAPVTVTNFKAPRKVKAKRG